VVFEETVHPNGQRLNSARIIPFRGSWVEFTVDIHDVVYVHIDKRKKFPATALLRALGYGTNSDILRLFYAKRELDLTTQRDERVFRREVLGALLAEDVPNPEDREGEPLGREGDEIAAERYNALRKAGVRTVHVFGRYTTIDLREDDRPPTVRERPEKQILAFDVPDPETGEVVVEAGKELSDTLRKRLLKASVNKVDVFIAGGRGETPVVKNTLAKDPTTSEADALEQIYSLLRPGEAPNLETARTALERLFFNPKRYDLGRVGRYKINQRLKVAVPAEHTVLTKDDFVAIIRYLLELSEGRGYTDDIDHLGNRRVRTVGELIANQFSVGLSRMARLIKERMSINNDPEKITLDDLVNARTVSAVIQAFFGSSQLSQFMDQTNPLAELTNKRRLSALGPGGLTRERAGFEVRDVHYSQYGRMCPIETPEGPNIGLITSLSTYARVNALGFVETPYRIVRQGVVTNDIRWLSASEEEEFAVAQANAPLDESGRFANEVALCRKRDDYPLLAPARIDYMDVAPEQLVSIAAALIPFLEHDDANRALMGSNMQRQAVPLLFPEAPLVCTGLERKVASDSGAVVTARRPGVVGKVTADEIIVDTGRAGREQATPLGRLIQHDRYRLKKFWRTNQDTAINQRPLIAVGATIEAGDVIADGASTDGGTLALGANVLVAFMPWYGHNFEDAIVISERLVKDDTFSSIHIQELELHVRDTKRGQEEITREIPNVSEEALVDLDERGIVRIGAHVKPGDILVGKITPKGETELSPEEKLLTAIFGEKAKDVKDSSLKVPPGMEGVVIDVKIFSRIEDQVVEKDRGERIGEVRRLESEEKSRISGALFDELKDLLAGQEVAVMLKSGTVEEYLPEGAKLTRETLDGVRFTDVDLKTLRVHSKPANDRVRAAIDAAGRERARVEEKAEDSIDKILQPDDLPPGVIQLVKVYLAEKRKISVGDKMAGRHGNKGIIARIVPEEDMPFLPDGMAVDVVLNPLGVPSRMNVGQILETHLGWCARVLGFRADTPVFQGANETEIGLLVRLAGLRWARRALQLQAAPPELDAAAIRRLLDDLRRLPPENGGPPDLAQVRLDALASRALTQGTRDVFHATREFLERAAKEIADHRRKEADLQREYHAARQEGDGELSRADKAAVKAGLKAAEKLAGLDPSGLLDVGGLPALAKLLGPKSEADVESAADELLRLAGFTPMGKAQLRDGRTGERFAAPVTVGAIYMMKLSHLVDDKIHARSIGPYSLVTQQPLAGKAQFGGQRFGEMEVWALEAYGASHTLQEMLTVKSDDVNGRSRVYEAIVKGQNLPEPGTPESFNVLVKELQALGLKVELGVTEEGEE
jgi:DNA-directed RNA polymerase subunit beta